MEDKLINTRSCKYSLQTTNTANINMIRHSVCEKINLEMCCKAHRCVNANFNLKAFTSLFRIMSRSKDMDTFLMDFKYYL